jgi:surfactin synthase thioesterase subunit
VRIASNSWIQPLDRAPAAGARLFCLPHAGGTASFFRPLAAALSGRVQVLGVQYPGRQGRLVEPALTSLAELADRIVVALEPWLDQPFALFGHSMGALLGFEVALRLERAGQAPGRLFASAHHAPSRSCGEQIHQLDDRGLMAELRRLNGTDMAILDDPDLIEIVLATFRADVTAVETYRATPGSVLHCPITVLLGDEDPTTTVESGRAWAAHTTGAHQVVVLPGGHFYLTDQWDQVVRIVADGMAVAAG